MSIEDAHNEKVDLVAQKPASDRWEELRKLSVQPGGFGSERVEIWPWLLHAPASKVEKGKARERESLEDDTPHRDERQIRLDTERSFVLYPVGPTNTRNEMQETLQDLIVSIFRKRPKLNYFQGYHDIVSVLFLTLPLELRLVCAEKLSLHRVRDSMGTTLEPVLGLVRVTKNLLRLADPDYANLLEQSSPLPFHALSNLLTLFAHDMPTLALIQHVFDYLLCRPPIITVYLATAIILSRKWEVKRLEEDGDDGMIHSLLSSLPTITDDMPKKEVLIDSMPVLKDEAVDIKLESFESELALEAPSGDETTAEPLVNSESQSDETKVPNGPVLQDPMLPETPIVSEANCDLNMPVKEAVEAESNEKPDLSNGYPRPPNLTLSDLLVHADSLYEQFPPTHESLSLSSIMGPQSVIFTWSESAEALPSDNTAESMVTYPDLIVYPSVEEPESKEGRSETIQKGKRLRRKLQKPRKIEHRAMFAGAIVVLGLAMAVYGMKTRSGTKFHVFGDAHSHSHFKDWRKTWVGGALVSASAKVLNGLTQ